MHSHLTSAAVVAYGCRMETTRPTAAEVADLRTAWLDARDAAAIVYLDARDREIGATVYIAGADLLVGEAAARYIEASERLNA